MKRLVSSVSPDGGDGDDRDDRDRPLDWGRDNSDGWLLCRGNVQDISVN